MIYIYYSYVNLKCCTIVRTVIWFLSTSPTCLCHFSHSTAPFLLLKQFSVLLMPGGFASLLTWNFFSPSPLVWMPSHLPARFHTLPSLSDLFKSVCRITLSHHLVYFPPGVCRICNDLAHLLACQSSLPHLELELYECRIWFCLGRASSVLLWFRWKVPRYGRPLKEWLKGNRNAEASPLFDVLPC